jgi:signal transduction histidine kinase
MLSIKQKQVLGVTSLVAMVVVALSLLQMITLTRVLLEQSQARGELLSEAIVHIARGVVTSRESAYQELARDERVRAALESALFSRDVTYAAIVDPSGMIVAHSDPTRSGERVPPGGRLVDLVAEDGIAQLSAVYSTGRNFEFSQPLLLDGAPFAELRIGFSTLLVRNELDAWLRPAIITAAFALVIAVLIAIGLSQVVLRPIHVIRSGLTRLGQGDLGATLDLQGDEFKDLGDVFASVSKQLQATMPDSVKRTQLLELSRRVTSLGRLTAGVAHEVKNPLNAMTIHLELLKQKLEDGDGSASSGNHLEIIGREIRRLDDVVQGFLKFAKPEELTLQPIAPGEITGEILKMLEPEAHAAGVTLEHICDPGTPPIEADPSILRQALVNLAKNAVQAMPDGGRLTVTCAETRDGRIEIRIADTGIGIAPANLAKIFDLYYTTKAHGTGIGLSLVYRTIQLHNGDIDVESTPGSGTTFIIKLPKSHGAVSKEPENLRSLKGAVR